MRPANQSQAREQMWIFMSTQLTGRSKKHKNQVLKECCNIGEILWRRWQVNLEYLQLKHCKWLMLVYLRDKSPGTHYRYWRRLREIMKALGTYDNWEGQLRGPWCNSEGRPYTPRSKRGRPQKYQPKRSPKGKRD